MDILYINAHDIEALQLTRDEILRAVEKSLVAQGNRQTVLEPRVHLFPNPEFHGHFNVLRGYIEPLNVAGVKVVGDYVYNYKQNLPSEMALLNLYDPRTGAPIAIVDATEITNKGRLGAPRRAPENARGAAPIFPRLRENVDFLITLIPPSKFRSIFPEAFYPGFSPPSSLLDARVCRVPKAKGYAEHHFAVREFLLNRRFLSPPYPQFE